MARKRKIEPCPLCGSSAQLEQLDGTNIPERHYIHCTNHDCCICTWCVPKDKIPQLVKSWNKRSKK